MNLDLRSCDSEFISSTPMFCRLIAASTPSEGSSSSVLGKSCRLGICSSDLLCFATLIRETTYRVLLESKTASTLLSMNWACCTSPWSCLMSIDVFDLGAEVELEF